MKTPYRHVALLEIRIPDPSLRRGSRTRHFAVQAPLFSRPVGRRMLERLAAAYALALTALLQVLRNGLEPFAFDQIHPFSNGFSNSYTNPDWGGWARIEEWRPAGDLSMQFQRVFHRKWHTLHPAVQEGLARSLAAIAAGLAFARSPIAVRNAPDVAYYRALIKRLKRDELTRHEAAAMLSLDRRDHHRIHVSTPLTEGEADLLPLTRALLHEASHAFADTRDHCYSSCTALQPPGPSASPLAYDRPGGELSAMERFAFDRSDLPDPDLLPANADSLTFLALSTLFHGTGSGREM